MGSSTTRSIGMWTWEIASLVASIAQFVAMIAILISFDGKEIFDGPLVTLNTVVSILALGSKASLLTLVANCISQANWSLFSGPPRRLYDFEIVADASRGPLGSLRLLISRSFKGGAIVRAGASITILAIGLGPFAQQLIQIEQRQAVENGGRFARAQYYDLSYAKSTELNLMEDEAESYVAVTTTPVNFGMQAAVMYGLTGKTKLILQQSDYDCPGSHCEFPEVTSLAVCSKCVNLESSLERREKQNSTVFSVALPNGVTWQEVGTATEFKLPNGLFLDNLHNPQKRQRVLMTMLGTSNSSKTVGMKDIDTLIWSQSVIKMNNETGYLTKNESWTEPKAEATECALYYCAKDYTFEARNGTLMATSSVVNEAYKRNPNSWKLDDEANMVGSEFAPPPLPADQQESLAFHRNYSWYTRSDLQLSKDFTKDEGWNITQTAVEVVNYIAQSVFSTCKPDERKNCSAVAEDRGAPTGYLSDQYRTTNLRYDPEVAQILWDSDDIPQTFENLAMSMSNTIRAGDSMQSTDEGKVLHYVTVYKIRWVWVVLHATVEVSAALFLILTLLYKFPTGGKIPVWKSSEMAAMSKGSQVSDVFKGARTLEELNKLAKEASVKLVIKDGEPTEFVGEEYVQMVGKQHSSQEYLGRGN
ncbi:unnamed protein product [Clonostachys rhizophaga]|uniref:Uncharacterized protein n=1 Tax=Clonostachys rhizophaga TaxID=160324 RepID=A0A9N9VCJ4_9HYPO|nr:unnamed protein product [Clonostachys rhizophaga]